MLVPTVRTPISISEYARGVVRAWPAVAQGSPSEASVAVLYAQYMTETGGRACWNWNIGNVKHVAGDGFDHCALSGVWEGVTKGVADDLIAKGLATIDTAPDHVRAVGPGRVAIVLSRENPGSWFRAYPNLEIAMRSHLEFLAKHRYASAWKHVLSGDPVAFAFELKAKGYFTASAQAYANLMRPSFDAFVHATAYEEAIAELEPPPDAIHRATVVAPRGLNLRTEPSAQARRVAHMPAGSTVHVLREIAGTKLETTSPSAGGWSEVLLGRTRGYCVSEWLVRIVDAPPLSGMVEVEYRNERWLVSPVQFAPTSLLRAREHAASLGCELPSPGLVDAIWRAADLRISPADMIRQHDGTPATMDAPEVHEEQRAKLQGLLGTRFAGRDFTLMAGAFKDVVEDEGRLGLYGWHVSDGVELSVPTYAPATSGPGRVVQPPFFGHSPDWSDYSQAVRLVRRV